MASSKRMKGLFSAYKYTILSILVIVIFVVYFFVDPSRYVWMPKCPVKLLTSLSCPSCGFQRALHSTLQGDLEKGISYNPFLLVAIPLVCVWVVVSLLIDHTTNHVRKGKMIFFNRMLIYIYIACYVCWFVVRNVFGI